MKIAIACDHGGFPLKETVIAVLKAVGHEYLDLGTHSTESVDYPDYAEKLGRAIQTGEADRGVLLCGSGVGACIAARNILCERAVFKAIAEIAPHGKKELIRINQQAIREGMRLTGC